MAKKVFTDESLETFVDEIKAYTDTAVSTKANSSHNHSASDITSGTLPISRGGTGATTAAAALTSLGITATATELNKLDGVTATTTELNYVDGVTSNIQTQLDNKAASTHGTHVTWSTTTPKAAGTAAVGSETKVARGDHVHPTDTSRASKADFDSHTSDTTKHITSTERTNWGTAYTHSQTAHAPSNAQKNQNAFSNIAVSGQTTVAADTATDTVTFAGSNVSITTDATNDKVTFTVADGTTSAKGVVKLTNSTSSTSTTTAATPSSVKSAYDLANTAKTNAATAQARADAAYTLADGKVDSLSDLGITATAVELNYVDGVTSGVQSQLDGKVPTTRKVNNKALSADITLSASDVGARADTWLPTAAEISALPIIDAQSANYDMDATLLGGKHNAIYMTNSNTLGTPYKKGTSSFTNAMIISYAGFNSPKQGFQIAIMNGAKGVYLRRAYGGVVEEWGKIYSSLDKPTAADVGAMPIIDARSANYDMDAIIKSGAHYGAYITNTYTLGTPYKYGKSDFGHALIVSFAGSASYGQQFAIIHGASCLFHRRLSSDGTIGAWSKIYSELYKPTLSALGITASNTDIAAGSSLTTGHQYLVYA